MYLGKYEELTGITVSTADADRYSASCRRSRRILEKLLGYSLDSANVDLNQYAESGIAPIDSIYFIDDSNIVLNPADAVVKAYRLFSYNQKDDYLKIDPCTAIHKVKLVKNDVTYRVFTTQEYRSQTRNGIIKYIELLKYRFLFLCNYCESARFCAHLQGFQLAVDADWLWPDAANLPEDLLDVWAEMVTYYADQKRDIERESIGGHLYIKAVATPPETRIQNLDIIRKYAGGNGTSNLMPVI